MRKLKKSLFLTFISLGILSSCSFNFDDFSELSELSELISSYQNSQSEESLSSSSSATISSSEKQSSSEHSSSSKEQSSSSNKSESSQVCSPYGELRTRNDEDGSYSVIKALSPTETDGEFRGALSMDMWWNVSLWYGGNILTFDNTTFTGLVINHIAGAPWTDELYDETGSGTFYRSKSGLFDYEFKYNVNTATVTVSECHINVVADLGGDKVTYYRADESGKYTGKRLLKQWDRFELKYYDSDGNESDINPTTTDCSGSAYRTFNETLDGGVYWEYEDVSNGISAGFYTSDDKNKTYQWTYTPSTKNERGKLEITTSDPEYSNCILNEATGTIGKATKGVCTITEILSQWGCFKLCYFNNDGLSTRLTPDNCTVIGLGSYTGTLEAEELYYDDGTGTEDGLPGFYCEKNGGGTYTATYNIKSNTLTLTYNEV